MVTLERIDEVRAAARGARARGTVVGLVPTMGALHEGHLSLIRRAGAECGLVIVSVFVNPLQFGPGEDFERYPRTLAEDARLSESAGADVVFAPATSEMYPGGKPLTAVSVSGLTARLCGAHRPGHFDGVTTVVAKLLAVCEPDRAYFGAKDYQQYRVIARMAEDLNLAVGVVPCPIVREPDGLAMSSRNAFLGPEERVQALSLSRGLLAAREAYRAGERAAATLLAAVYASLSAAPLGVTDYVEMVDAVSLEPVPRADSASVIAVAVRFPSARLIDSIALD
jgi:pantoate--beta-alanine ligase